jgi:hypothetical protein
VPALTGLDGRAGGRALAVDGGAVEAAIVAEGSAAAGVGFGGCAVHAAITTDAIARYGRTARC